MGFFDRFLDAVRLNDDYDDDDDFFDDDDDFDEVEEPPKKRLFGRSAAKKAAEEEEDETPVKKPFEPHSKPQTGASRFSAAKNTAKPAASSAKVTPMRKGKGITVSNGSMEVCVIKPTRVEDYREIADTLLSGCTVVLNLEGIDVELAQRIIDFSSGSCYAIGGGLQKVSSYIFILTPSNVEISGDIQDLLGGAIPSMRNAF